MRGMSVCVAVMVFLWLSNGMNAGAGEVEILIDKLVEKGVLSAGEAGEIMKEVKEQAGKERTAVVKQAVQSLQQDNSILRAGDVPRWIKNTKFSGDFRLRYQLNDRHGAADRHRGRYRLRLGCVTPITDRITVGFGIATGGSNPRSTNQSMDNTFETPDVRLDYAYAAYQPFGWLTVIAGKFKNPLWFQKYFLWDTDIRPEGVAALFRKKVHSSLELFCAAGWWLLDEQSDDENDPAMIVMQPGCTIELGSDAYLKNALTIYSFDNVEGLVLDHSSGSNTLTRNGSLRHDYDAVVFSTEIGTKTPFGFMPSAALFADYIENYSVSSQDSGFLIGCRLGYSRLMAARQWQLFASYRRLERDSWVDTFPDADVYSGQTNIKGWQGGLQYGLADNVYMVVNYLFSERIRGKSLSENILQVDFNIKF